ncbi:MAG: hypothetical protein WCX73_00205 [Candidatus Pacearchaeota archaeon]|jgi:hypothetical protein
MKNSAVLGLIFLLSVGFLAGLVCAEKIEIQMENSYVPGEDVSFKLILYDDQNNKIDGQISYFVQNYYSEVVEQGISNSDKEVVFKLPENAIQGPWKVSAKYNEVEAGLLFNVGELELADIKLEGDTLVLKNIGNSVYDKKILIYIGTEDQTADITLEVGQEKRIRLTAPDGNYNIKVIEGNEEKTIEFNDVPLTGNVVGLERVLNTTSGFWQRYPLVSLFLGALLLVIVIVGILKFINRKSH